MCSIFESNLKKMRDFIQKNKETKDLKMKDEEVIIVYNYLHNKDKKNIPGYKMVLKKTPTITIIYQATHESEQIEFENELYRKHLFFNHNFNLDNFLLADFKKDSIIRKKVFTHVKDIIKNFSKIEKGLYLYGGIGTGKSFLLKCLAKNLIEKKIPILFIYFPDLVRQFKNIWANNDIIEKKIHLLKNISCLFLDDLGSENMNILFRDEVLLPLLHYRCENKMPTFFSSNFDLESLDKYLNSFTDYSNGIKAFKIISKIKQMTFLYNLDL
ncbi:DNA replication protein [Candidatus Phytoplasma luffae]|uniref:DNA replication protein n=1 Tax=Loofah witches'-broom phytoplasma TaxID=35773 RepID=A0A975FKR7_LOWBP|nr:ATP-binding protein [Candidatus Phytoplasma luffae]QTX03253.1 DNA replication protein [Candidatus Phytoplasma luffae]